MNDTSRILWLLLLFFTVEGSFAQETTITLQKDVLYPGCIFTSTHDTSAGFIFYKSLIHNQTEVIFYDSATRQKPGQNYQPGEIKGYIIAGMVYYTVPFSGRYSSRRSSFMYCLVEGRVSLYKWYFDEKQQYFEDNAIWDYQPVYDDNYQEQLFVVKPGEKPLELSDYRSMNRFHIVMSRYLADNEELALKIKKKQMGYTCTDLYNILNEYNMGSIIIEMIINEQ